VNVTDLVALKRKVNESAMEFLERFRNMAGRCSVQFLEAKYATIVMGNMHFHLRKKLRAQECNDMNQLASKATRVEQLIIDKEQIQENKGRGPQLESIVDSDEYTTISIQGEAKIMASKIARWKALLLSSIENSESKNF